MAAAAIGGGGRFSETMGSENRLPLPIATADSDSGIRGGQTCCRGREVEVSLALAVLTNDRLHRSTEHSRKENGQGDFAGRLPCQVHKLATCATKSAALTSSSVTGILNAMLTLGQVVSPNFGKIDVGLSSVECQRRRLLWDLGFWDVQRGRSRCFSHPRPEAPEAPAR